MALIELAKGGDTAIQAYLDGEGIRWNRLAKPSKTDLNNAGQDNAPAMASDKFVRDVTQFMANINRLGEQKRKPWPLTAASCSGHKKKGFRI
jgi:hypothetical protein